MRFAPVACRFLTAEGTEAELDQTSRECQQDRMSDSDGEQVAAAGGQKKDFMYKVKAFKRRTLHAVQKVS